MFLAPMFLLGLFTVAIPLVLHLRRSTRIKKIPFSTTRFFDEQFIRSSRRARFQDLLLMLLRVALLVLFVLALSQPLLRLPGLAALSGGRRSVAIVLDDSASMGLADSGGSLLDRGKRGALALVNNLSPARGDRVTLVLAGRREAGARVVFAEPTKDLAAVRSAIAGVRVTDLGTDLTGAIAAAGRALGVEPGKSGTAAGGNREVYVFSDMQASAFAQGQRATAGPGVGLLMVSTRAGQGLEAENVSVDAIQYGAPQPMIGVPFSFRTLLTNHSDHARGVSAKLVIDDQTLSQKPVEIPPGRSKVVRFVHRFTKAGWYRGRIELGSPPPSAGGAPAATAGADSLPVDDRRYFALRVDESVRLLAINGAPSAVPTSDELFFLRLALTVNPAMLDSAAAGVAKATGPIRFDTGTIADATPSQLAAYPLVVLANVAALPPESVEALEHYVDGGGNLFITLGDRVDPKLYNTWIGDSRLHGGLLPGRLTELAGNPHAAEEAGGPGGAADPAADAGFVASVADEHPALAGFADGQLGSLSSVRFTARYRLDAPADAVLMRTPSGDAVLAEKRFGRGRVMLFTSSIDRDWTNFPLQPAFVPWLYRIVGYLAQGTLEDAGFVRTGQVVALPSSATQVEALRVECPDGAAAYPEPARSHASSRAAGMEISATEQAGVYAVRSATEKDDHGPRLLFAANLPSDESDAHGLDEKGLRNVIDAQSPWAFVDAPESAVDAGDLARHGFGLWDQLLFLALLVALFEPWLANRLSRRRGRNAADAMGQRDVGAAERVVEKSAA